MPNIRIPGALHRFTGGVSDVEVAATTVRDALAELERRHPGIAAKVLDNGAVKPFIRIFVGAEDIGGLSGLETRLSERDEVAIVPAIAGGRSREVGTPTALPAGRGSSPVGSIAGGRGAAEVAEVHDA